jgi:hypothetical protein
MSVFTAEMFLTAVMVLGQLVARQNKTNVVFIAFPSAIALYFANSVVTMLCSGFNNPVVAMIVCIQNRKYFYYIQRTSLPIGEVCAMFFGPFAGAILGGLMQMYLLSMLHKIESEKKSIYIEDRSEAQIEKMLATSMAIYNQEQSTLHQDNILADLIDKNDSDDDIKHRRSSVHNPADF